MSFFQNAVGITINDGKFINQTQGPGSHPNSREMDLLIENVAMGALHNSGERFDPPKCHPDTRSAVLDAIDRWARDYNQPKPIYWVNGAAGAGKSAILQTISERWSKVHPSPLGASFFFGRTAAKRNVKLYLVPTIAYQLSCSSTKVRRHIESAILNDTGIFAKNLRTQMEELIAKPLLRAGVDRRLVIVIDGLDECAGEETHRDILDAIGSIMGHFQDGPVLFFLIASRPERQIRDSFADESLGRFTTPITLNEAFDPDRDIELFLRCRLGIIAQKHPTLASEWPSDNVIGQLVKKSSDPVSCLQIILDLKTPVRQSDRPFEQLDALFTFILGTVDEESIQFVRDALTVLLYYPLPDNTKALDDLLSPWTDDLHTHLTDLHSLLEIPAPKSKGWTQEPIRFNHASFSDFLTDPLRSGSYHIGKDHVPICISRILLNRMLYNVFNECAIVSLSTHHVLPTLMRLLRVAHISADIGCLLEMLIKMDEGAYARYVEPMGVYGPFHCIRWPTSIWRGEEIAFIRQYIAKCGLGSKSPSQVGRFTKTKKDIVKQHTSNKAGSRQKGRESHSSTDTLVKNVASTFLLAPSQSRTKSTSSGVSRLGQAFTTDNRVVRAKSTTPTTGPANKRPIWR